MYNDLKRFLEGKDPAFEKELLAIEKGSHQMESSMQN